MTDDADLIAQKIRKARTDPLPLPGNAGDLGERPEAYNLIGIYAALADISRDQVCAQFDGAQFSSFKNDLADLAISSLSPITAEMRRLLDDSAYIDQVLLDGAARADVIAAPILREVQYIVGFLQP